MRRCLLTILACALCAFLCTYPVLPAWAGQIAWGKLRVASGVVIVRESPKLNALKVRTLKNGQLVRIDFEADGWAAVFDPAQKKRSESAAWGYARVENLRLAGALDLPRTPMTSSHAPLESIEVSKSAQVEGSKPKPKKGIASHAARGNETEPSTPAIAEPDHSLHTASAEQKESPAAVKQHEKSVKGIINAGKDAAKFGKVTPAGKKAEKMRPMHPPKPFGEIRVADRDLAVRSQRTKESDFITVLRPGQRVRVDFLGDGFYAVFDVDETVRDESHARGYSRDKFLLTEKDYAEAVKDAVPSQGTPKKSESDTAKSEKAVTPDAQGAKNGHATHGKVARSTEAPAAQTEKPVSRRQLPAANATLHAEPAPAAVSESVKATPVAPVMKKPKEHEAVEAKHEAAGSKKSASDGVVVAYTVLERRADPLRPFAPLVVCVRLDADQPPTGDALRRVVREIWSAEHQGAGEMQLEVFLPGAESNSLAYAVARFAKDGRLRDFLWRESLLRIKK